MCRISGSYYFNYRGNDKFAHLLSMLERQRHGGPDGQGTWISDNVGLNHNRLAILDLSDSGKQPMESENWVLAYNGEVYNHLELRGGITREWKSHSDSETILYLLETYGVKSTLALIEGCGMFALAAYNKREEALYLATDPMGIKPMYYSYEPDQFHFASSVGALATRRKWSLNHESLIDFLALGATRQSLFSGIYKVEAGELITITRRSDMACIGREYYTKIESIECSESELLEVTLESIRASTLSDVPVYLFLSGGIDSTVIASQLRGISAVHLESPELEFAQKVAGDYQNRLITIDPARYSAEQCLSDYAAKSGDCSMAAIQPYVVSKEVSRFGKVAISANGADELFFGYDRIKEYTTDAQINHIFRNHFYQQSNWRHYTSANSRMLELESYVRYDLNKTLDYASMCHGVEIRVPYLNKVVVEHALGVNRNTHRAGYGNKSILKRYLSTCGYSPAFLNRPKVGFSLFSEPIGYEELKQKGVDLLRDEFDIIPHLFTERDKRYYEASAAAFYCWFEIWKHQLK